MQPAFAQSEYLTNLMQWRERREEGLRAEDSWPSLAGLFWPLEGRNLIGSAEEAQVLLPRGPEWADTLVVSGGDIHLESGELVPLKFAGNTFPGLVLAEFGLKLIVVQRETHFVVRLLDNLRPEHLNFPGLDWFVPNQEWCIEARFEPHPEPLRVPIVDVLGRVRQALSPGFAVFEWQGHQHRLIAESEKPEQYLFFNFRDASNGRSTYPAGRFLYSKGIKKGRVVLDFNHATNPMCAYTRFATCPLPPLPNRLPFAVQAGEQYIRLKAQMEQSEDI